MAKSPLPEGVRAAIASFETAVEVLPCDPTYADTADFCAHYGYPLQKTGNTIIVASRRGPKVHAACVVAADRRLDVNRRVRGLLGVSKLSFAGAEETREVTGMDLGGVTVVGLPLIPIYVDALLMEFDWLVLGAGTRSAKLKTSPALFHELPSAEIVEDLSTPAVQQ